MAVSGAMVSVPNIRRRRLGAALRRLREGSGMSLEAVAKELGWSTSKISRIELAKIAVISPACAPSPSPTSWLSEAGVQTIVETE